VGLLKNQVTLFMFVTLGMDVADVHRTFIVFISAKLASSRKKANIGQIYQLCQNIFPKRKGCKDFGFLAVKLYV